MPAQQEKALALDGIDFVSSELNRLILAAGLVACSSQVVVSLLFGASPVVKLQPIVTSSQHSRQK